MDFVIYYSNGSYFTLNLISEQHEIKLDNLWSVYVIVIVVTYGLGYIKCYNLLHVFTSNLHLTVDYCD